VDKIKVIVASRPRLMREIVLEIVSAQPDIEVMAEVQDDSAIAELVGRLHPDWVVIALDDSDNKPSICDLLFGRYPDLKILALDSGRNNCIFYRATMSIRSSRVESSEKGILDALRGRRPVSSGAVEVPGNTKVN
jgi:DNA-binding NarL/FixJ family response regulator